jgi:hypothetical protein
MKEEAVLRVPRTDDDDAYVLVHVKTGTKGVAFELEATEGEHPYLVARMYMHSKWSYTPCIANQLYTPTLRE